MGFISIDWPQAMLTEQASFNSSIETSRTDSSLSIWILMGAPVAMFLLFCRLAISDAGNSKLVGYVLADREVGLAVRPLVLALP